MQAVDESEVTVSAQIEYECFSEVPERILVVSPFGNERNLLGVDLGCSTADQF